MSLLADQGGGYMNIGAPPRFLFAAEVREIGNGFLVKVYDGKETIENFFPDKKAENMGIFIAEYLAHTLQQKDRIA